MGFNVAQKCGGVIAIRYAGIQWCRPRSSGSSVEVLITLTG